MRAKALFLLGLACAPLGALANVVQRCEAADGHITFTSLGCSAGEKLSPLRLHPSPPNSSAALLPEAEGRETSNMNRRGRALIDQNEDNPAKRISEGRPDRKAKSRTAKSPQ